MRSLYRYWVCKYAYVASAANPNTITTVAAMAAPFPPPCFGASALFCCFGGADCSLGMGADCSVVAGGAGTGLGGNTSVFIILMIIVLQVVLGV